MSEGILRCPRCGTQTEKTAGRCSSCGLRIGFRRHSSRRRSGAASRQPERVRRASPRAGRIDVTLERGGPDFQPRPGGGPGGAHTQRYDINEFEAQQPDRKRADGTRIEAPKGGDAEVGTMAQFMMDPADDIVEMQKQAAKSGNGKAGDGLALGVRKYGAPEEKKHKETQVLESSDALQADDFFRQLEELAADTSSNGGKKSFPVQTAPTVDRARYMLTRVLPQVVVLLVILIAGPCLLPQPISLNGDYTAVFSDNEGREVTCTTRFSKIAGEAGALRGLFECTLYASRTTLDRIDEPHVLKPIMGDGEVSYNGRVQGNNIQLRLGSFDGDDTRAVVLNGRTADGGLTITGTMENSLGSKAKASITRPEY